MKKKAIEVAYITNGYSAYHDDLWNWLNLHRNRFGIDENINSDYYDFIGAWGLLALCGCTIRCHGDKDAPIEYRTDYGVGVSITFRGDIKELIRRLDCEGSAIE